MKKILTSSILLALVGLGACSYSRNPDSRNYDPNDPGFVYEFEGDMYYSVPYDPLSQWEHHQNPYNKDSLNMRLPVKGTIARGKLAYWYPYPNTVEGYEKAGAELRNPVPNTAENLAEGKRLFQTYCWQCHGKEGEGDGSLWVAGVFPPSFWKTYKSDYIRGLPEGKMYHTITNGKGAMGSHASQLSPEQRWKIIHFIKYIANSGGGNNAAGASASADSTKTSDKATADTKTSKNEKK